MLKRLWHLFVVGHKPRVMSTTYNQPIVKADSVYTEGANRQFWGFTEVVLSCDCGKLYRKRYIGNHSNLTTAIELATLEKLL